MNLGRSSDLRIFRSVWAAFQAGLGWSPNSGMDAVKRVALEAGAYGCTINGAGPMVVAVTDNEEKGREIGEKMVEAFMEFETFGDEEIRQSWERR